MALRRVSCFLQAGVGRTMKKGFCQFFAGRAFGDGAKGVAVDSELERLGCDRDVLAKDAIGWARYDGGRVIQVSLEVSARFEPAVGMPISGQNFKLCAFGVEVEEDWSLGQDGSGWIDKELTGLKQVVKIGGQDRFDKGEGIEGRRVSPYRNRAHGIVEDRQGRMGILPDSFRMQGCS